MNSWDKHLEPTEETVIEAHGRRFIVSSDTARAFSSPHDGRAVFSRGEIRALKRTADGSKLPASLSLALHLVKRIVGGRIERCRLDRR